MDDFYASGDDELLEGFGTSHSRSETLSNYSKQEEKKEGQAKPSRKRRGKKKSKVNNSVAIQT